MNDQPQNPSCFTTKRAMLSASALLSLSLFPIGIEAQNAEVRNFVELSSPPVEEMATRRLFTPGVTKEETVLEEKPAARRPEVAVEREATAVRRTGTEQEPAIVSSEIRRVTRSLGDLLGEFEPIRMQSVEPVRTIPVSVSSRMEVVEAKAAITYTNSISLNEELSHLALLWDQEVLAQAPLLRNSPSGRMVESLPGLPFDAGYHELGLRAAQHYVRNGECEDPASSVLWSQIDPLKSTVTFDYRWRPVGRVVLSELPDLIDPKLWGDYTLSIVTEHASAMQDHHLRWGALMSQRAANLLDYKPLEVAHHTALTGGYDQVAIGTRAELTQILPGSIMNRVRESFIGIYPHPVDEGHFLLVISGESVSDVNMAVEAIALNNISLPASSEMVVDSVELPLTENYETDLALGPNEKVAISELGFETRTVAGLGAPSLDVEVVLPPDLYADEAANVVLNLHFAHGAALRADSVLNVKLNEKFAHAIYLKQADGATYRDYKVEIPLRSFRAGKNKVAFQPVLMPLESGHCEIINQENLLFTMFDDTEISIPNASHYVRLPDLNLWRRTAFPAMVDPQGENFTLHVASKDSDTISSAFMMAGKIAQVNGSPMVNMAVSSEIPQGTDHWMTIGPWSSLISEMVLNSPVKLGREGRIPAILAHVPDARDGEVVATARREADARRSIVKGSASAGNKGVLLQFRSSLDPSASGMALTAESRSVLRERTRELIKPGVWEGQSGDTFVWSGTDASQQRAQRLGDSFYLGKAGVRTKAVYHFSHRPWMSVVVAIVLVGLLAGLVRSALAKFHRRNHAGAEA